MYYSYVYSSDTYIAYIVVILSCLSTDISMLANIQHVYVTSEITFRVCFQNKFMFGIIGKPSYL